MVEAERDAVRVEVGGGVVAEELGVAEDEAGAVMVVGVPGEERKDGEARAAIQRRCVRFGFWRLRMSR